MATKRSKSTKVSVRRADLADAAVATEIEAVEVGYGWRSVPLRFAYVEPPFQEPCSLTDVFEPQYHHAIGSPLTNLSNQIAAPESQWSAE